MVGPERFAYLTPRDTRWLYCAVPLKQASCDSLFRTPASSSLPLQLSITCLVARYKRATDQFEDKKPKCYLQEYLPGDDQTAAPPVTLASPRYHAMLFKRYQLQLLNLEAGSLAHQADNS